jgi:DNA polymerase
MLYIDLEVFSEIDLTTAPLDVYANDPSTKIIVACMAFDAGPVVEFSDETGIESFMAVLRGYKGNLCAWNIGYERTVLAGQGFKTPLDRWYDTMVHARYVGLPGGLKQCCKVDFLGVPASAVTKSETLLINKFCKPGKPVEALKGWYAIANSDESHPERKARGGTSEEFAVFVDYCRKDVESLRYLDKYLRAKYPFPDSERKVWLLDQEINERGLPIDIKTATHAAAETVRLTGEAYAELKRLTSLDNPNSVQQLLPWLKERGYPYDSLGKEYVQQAREHGGATIQLEGLQVLDLRLSAAKSSVKKFAAIVAGTSPDGRLRNQFRYYGAHTGRWSGRGAQPQNLPRTPTDPDILAEVINMANVKSLDQLSTCIRPMIAAGPGKKLVWADLSAIENCALAWLSGCEAMLDIYREGKDPYKDFATRLYGIPYEKVSKAQRGICKPAVLGCGYGLGPGMERQMANGQTQFTGLRKYAESMGVELSAADSRRMVSTFRDSFYEVVDYWGYLQQAFYAAAKSKKRQQVGAVVLGWASDAVYIELPSGRRIHYLNPKVWKGEKGLEIRFDGLRNGQWWTVTTWGGSLCENVVQAFARDVLVTGMLRAEKAGMTIVGHCHDEIICETPRNCGLAEEALAFCMSASTPWAPGLPLKAEGFEGPRYLKSS